MNAPPDLHHAVELGGARFEPIAPGDVPRIASAAERASAWLWATYASFLASYGQSSARAVLVGPAGDGLVALVRRKIRGRDHLDLVTPPLASDPADALAALAAPLASYNDDLETRVLWADLPAAAAAAARGWNVQPYEQEYVYSRRAVLDMWGGEYRMLRKRVNRCKREADPVVRAYTPDDRPACMALLKAWQAEREEAVQPVFDFGYTAAALELAEAIPEPWLVGLVIDVEGAVRAFAFGGLIRPGVGCFFILKSDPAIIGLAETARVELIRLLEGCDLINDAGDLGRPGLAQHKREFRPAAFVPTWKLARRG